MEAKIYDLENSSSLKNIVGDQVFKDNPNVMVSAIGRIHRLEKPTSWMMRLVIFKLLDLSDKLKIFRNCYKLQDSGLPINEEFSR